MTDKNREIEEIRKDLIEIIDNELAELKKKYTEVENDTRTTD